MSAILPPLLPTVFTVSVGISDNRLAKKRIACSNSEDILIAGKVTKAFFDKTGTLTRQGLDFVSAQCRTSWNATKGTQPSEELALGMACCHNLTRSRNGELIGNPVDRTMFKASGAEMLEILGNIQRIQDYNGNSIDVLKRFDFDHHRMTQSVIVKLSSGELLAFVKGSGESLQGVCRGDTLPADYSDAVRNSAKSGTYQIAMGMKSLPKDADLNLITRDQIERELEFIGVINFMNILRSKTPSTIHQLESGEVQCFMVTGDSVHTGIRIAKEAGMIKPGLKVLLCSEVGDDGTYTWVDEQDSPFPLPSVGELQTGASGYELAVTGTVWEHMKKSDAESAAELAQVIRVYGRCNPFHKVSVVTTFVEMGFITLMCGDGGNDCGALKAAHVGVALSDAEASIVSPFTSLDKSITSVVDILKEGRCALASALASYKYVIMYGQLEGVVNVIMAYLKVNLTEYAWAFMDGLWVIGMSFTLPLAKAAKKLSRSRPTASLLGPHTFMSVFGVWVINVSFILIGLSILYKQPWMPCRVWDDVGISNLMTIGDNYESGVIFLITGFQFIHTAMAYNFGYEFRRNWLENFRFIFLCCIFSGMLFYVTLVPGKLSCFWRINCDNSNLVYSLSLGEKVPIQNPYATTVMPMKFRLILVTLMVLNAVLNAAWDYFVVNGIRRRLAAKKRNHVELTPAKGDDKEIKETV
jgi:predicted P-type ATPase